MENMKSLANQIREQLVKPAIKEEKSLLEKTGKKTKPKEEAAIITAILAFDTTANKSVAHTRFDPKTLRTMNQLKMATGIEVTRLVSFAVKHFFDTYPELKATIKQFIQNTEL